MLINQVGVAVRDDGSSDGQRRQRLLGPAFASEVPLLAEPSVLRDNFPEDPAPKKRKRPLFQGALQGPARRGKSIGAGMVYLFGRIRVVMSAYYDGEIPSSRSM